MAEVFVSYSRKDIDFARRLTDELMKSDLDFWIDWKGIPPTVDWWREIEKGIEEADVFLFLISPDSAKSKACRDEIECAVKNGKRLIPLLVRDTKGDERPAQLSHLNFIYFRENDDFDTALTQLLTGIHTDYVWVATHRELQMKAREWERGSKESSFLLRGKELENYEFQLDRNKSKKPYPTDLQNEYIHASRKAADWQRRITIGISIAGVIALAALAVWGWGQAGLATLNANESKRNEAKAQAASTLAVSNEHKAQTASTLASSNAATAVANEQEAKRQAQIALVRQWAAESNAILANPNGSTETSTLLSLRALEDKYIPSADAALVESLNRLYTTRIFDQHNSVVRRVAYSPKGDRILFGYGDGTADLYDLESHQNLKHFDGLDAYPGMEGSAEYSGVLAAEFSRSGNYLLVAGSGGYIRIWNQITNSESDIDLQTIPGVTWDMLWSTKFSPDEKFILVSTGYPHSGPGNIYLIERETGDLKYTFPQLQTRFISDVEFSPDGNSTLSTSFDGTAILWDMNWSLLGASQRTLIQMTAPIRDGAFSRDGISILLGSDSSIAELYNLEGVLEKQFVGHTSAIGSVAFSPSGKYILTTSWDHWARLWDIQSSQTIRTFSGHTDVIASAVFSPDDKLILTGSYDKTARLWNANPEHDTRTIYGHSNRITSVSYSPNGKTILSSSNDDSVRLWDSQTLEPESIHTSASLYDPIAVFSAQGKWIAASSGKVGGTDVKIVMWQKADSAYEQASILDPGQYVTSLAFSPPVNGKESEYLLLGRVDPSCNAYLLKNVRGSWEVVAGYFAYCWNYDVAFSQDAKFAAISVAYDIPIYQTDDGNQVADCIATLSSGDPYGSHPIAFSKDGKYLASQVENDVLIWDWQPNPGGNTPNSCTQVARLSGHSQPVTDLAFSPDGNYLLSASTDGTAIIWDTKTWDMIRTLTGHEGDISSAAFSPDSKFIVTAGGDKTIRIWDVDYKDTIKLVCYLLQRDFTSEERIKYGISDPAPTCGK